MLNLHAIERTNLVNGNGNRFVIWVQGCDLGCQGCWNTETWSFDANVLISVEDIFSQILETPHLNGITFTGGEPFLQKKELLKLAKLIKQQNLSLQVFTGFTFDEVQNSELLKYIDVLVTGRYGNPQKIYNPNNSNEFWNFDRDIEIDISEDGNLTVTGYPSDKFIKNLKNVEK